MSSWQSKFIADYNDKNRPKFNDVFFSKSDDAIIEDLKAMLISCQRDKYFTVLFLPLNEEAPFDMMEYTAPFSTCPSVVS